MEIKFQNITFIYSQVPRENRTIGSFSAKYSTETLKKIIKIYDNFAYISKHPEVLENTDYYKALDIGYLIMFCHYCIHFEPEINHKILVESDSPFFIVHDAFHALTDVILYDDVKGCEPFYRLSCQSECEADQLLNAYKFLHQQGIEVSDEYLSEVEKVYFNQNKKPLNILKFKEELCQV